MLRFVAFRAKLISNSHIWSSWRRPIEVLHRLILPLNSFSFSFRLHDPPFNFHFGNSEQNLATFLKQTGTITSLKLFESLVVFLKMPLWISSSLNRLSCLCFTVSSESALLFLKWVTPNFLLLCLYLPLSKCNEH